MAGAAHASLSLLLLSKTYSDKYFYICSQSSSSVNQPIVDRLVEAMVSISVGEKHFCVLLVLFSCSLYLNTLRGGFIWDDRAAVVTNEDVHGTSSSWSDLLVHDFWGQDITLIDSHKSYRPVTVLSYRLNFMLNGLSAFGYHLGNISLYSLVSVLFYMVSKQWLNRTRARTASLLFTFHPVHVEAVASIVGRADILCGMFYFLSLMSYTNIHRTSFDSNGGSGASNSLGSYMRTGFYFLFAVLMAFLASLSKEIGVTSFAMMIVIEVLEVIKTTMVKSKYYKVVSYSASGTGSKVSNGNFQRLENRNSSFTSSNTAAMGATVTTTGGYFLKSSLHIGGNIVIKAIKGVATTSSSLLRVLISVAAAYAFLHARLNINGEYQLYTWTVMENHIHLLPTFQERALSYGQSHFWYLMKLLYPRHLCFDYGYACIPTISSILDVKNVLPLFAYSAIGYVFLKALRQVSVALLFGLALMLISILPALNILVPVGTILAERLLFMPSAGFCIIISELIISDLIPFLCAVYDTVLVNPSRRLPVVASVLPSSPLYKAWESCGNINNGNGSNVRESATTKGGGMNGISNNNNNNSSRPTVSPKRDSSEARYMTAAAAATTTTFHGANSTDLCVQVFYFSIPLSYLLILPIIILFGIRVVSRNYDWATEFGLFSSALSVCPSSVKALTNFAVHATHHGLPSESFAAAVTAVDLYPTHLPVLINAALAYYRLGQYSKSLELLGRCLDIEPTHGKTHGYFGKIYYDWSASPQSLQQQQLNVDSFPSIDQMVAQLRSESLAHLTSAISLGFDPPAILHLCGSAYLENGELDLAIKYYEAALDRSIKLRAMIGDSKDVHIEDDINIPYTYNQLGNAYWQSEEIEKALYSFERGLDADPNTVQILNNLGNLYREMGNRASARTVMQRAIDIEKERAPSALVNNLGLLELDEGRFTEARSLFERALHQLHKESSNNSNNNKRGISAGDGSSSAAAAETYSTSGQHAELIITNNIAKALQAEASAAAAAAAGKNGVV